MSGGAPRRRAVYKLSHLHPGDYDFERSGTQAVPRKRKRTSTKKSSAKPRRASVKPARKLSEYNIFVRDYIEKERKRNPKKAMVQIFKDAAKAWKKR